MSCSYHPIRWHSISQNHHRCIMSWIRVRMTTTDHTHIHTHTHTHTWMVDCADGGKTVNGIKVLVSCPTATCTLASLRFCEEPRVHGLDTFEGEGPHHQNVAGREGGGREFIYDFTPCHHQQLYPDFHMPICTPTLSGAILINISESEYLQSYS